MKRSRFSEEQIISILREQEAGSSTADVCRKHGVSSAAFYKWKATYGVGIIALIRKQGVRRPLGQADQGLNALQSAASPTVRWKASGRPRASARQ